MHGLRRSINRRSRKDIVFEGQTHLRLGPYYLWVDAQGRLRIKLGPPTSDGDGEVVGRQK